MINNYCRVCGDKLVEKEIGDEGILPYCNSCKIAYFDEFKTCILVAVIKDDKVVLIKQKNVSDYWMLVAGYIKKGENGEETCKREIEEETGLEVKHVQYISSYYFEKKDLLMLGYIAFANTDMFGYSKEVDQINWFDLEDAYKLLKKDSIAYLHFNKCKELLNNKFF